MITDALSYDNNTLKWKDYKSDMFLINDINDNCSFVPNCREGQIKCTRGNYQDFLKWESYF